MITLDITTKPIKKIMRRAYVRRELAALGRIAKFLGGAFISGYAFYLIVEALTLLVERI